MSTIDLSSKKWNKKFYSIAIMKIAQKTSTDPGKEQGCSLCIITKKCIMSIFILQISRMFGKTCLVNLRRFRKFVNLSAQLVFPSSFGSVLNLLQSALPLF